MFSLDCGFNHVSYVWPDGALNGEMINVCLFQVDKSNHHQVVDHFVKSLHVSLPEGCLHGKVWPKSLVIG